MAMFIFIAVYKRNSIVNKVKKIIAKSSVNEKHLKTNEHIQSIQDDKSIVSEKDLKAFNQEPYSSFNGYFDQNYDKDIEILFLGNSLTYCTVPEEEPDKTLRGLTSTSIEKDYVHLLMKKVSESKKVNIKYSIINIASFERHFFEAPFEIEHIKNATVQNPDYIILQIGENVSGEDVKTRGDLLRTCTIDLLNNFPQSKKIITLPFWPDYMKNEIFTEIALSTNSYLIDISHLGSGQDPRNYASSYKEYKQPGVGAHPGDFGMENIAKCIYSVFNAE